VGCGHLYYLLKQESVFVMLEAIRARTQGWLAKLILALITVPFALFGIDAYLKDAGSSAPIAKVDGHAISVQEYSNALQNLRNRLQSEGQKDLSMLESPEIKASVLDRLIATQLVNHEVKSARFTVSDEQLSQYIVSLPEFQDKGKFSQERYNQLLQQNNLSSSKFEASIRNDLLAQQVRDGFANLTYLPASLADHTLKVEHQQREASVAEIKTADFISQTKVTPEQVKSYYEAHKDKFRVPEQVKVEFVMLSANGLIVNMRVTDDEIKKYYDENAAKFQGDEQRRASHILIAFGVSATPQAKLDAKKKAEQILAEVKKSPEKFAELAKKYSQDPGSAEKGGDLGLFGKGAMVKPFEEAVFSMTPGAISGLVESEFGYHIIKLTEITGAGQSLDDVKQQIRAELLYQKALAKFSEQAENFSNTVYEQSASLKPAADAFGLQVETSGWLSRADATKFFKNEKFANAIFSDEAIKEKRNTEAVDVGSNSLASAHVVEYKPAAPRSFDEVKGPIEDALKLEQAAKLAAQKGEATLAALRQGKEDASLEWIPSVIVDRKNAQGLTDVAMQQIFKMDTNKLPAYAGVADIKKGFLLVKVLSVKDGLSDETEQKTALQSLNSALADEYSAAYLRSLKLKAKINVNQQLLQVGASQ
jgi:peptidyl-prolyl cis-trans isomerase D